MMPTDEFRTTESFLLIEISKTFSGNGMDQNVIAHSCVPYNQVPDIPKIKRIFVRDLKEASRGNNDSDFLFHEMSDDQLWDDFSYLYE